VAGGLQCIQGTSAFIDAGGENLEKKKGSKALKERGLSTEKNSKGKMEKK